MKSTKDQIDLAGLHKKGRDYLRAHPENKDVLFQFTDPEVRDRALAGVASLDLHEAALLCDRIKYITRTRQVYSKVEVPRCRGKVIYTLRRAHAKVGQIWNQGRGHMRIYECPLCTGYHLTHLAHRDSDDQALMG